MEISVLIIRDDEHDVGDDEVASSEVAEVRERAGKTLGRGSGYPGPVSRGGETGGLRKFIILSYSYYIRILIINTSSMIYICYIFCGG